MTTTRHRKYLEFIAPFGLLVGACVAVPDTHEAGRQGTGAGVIATPREQGVGGGVPYPDGTASDDGNEPDRTRVGQALVAAASEASAGAAGLGALDDVMPVEGPPDADAPVPGDGTMPVGAPAADDDPASHAEPAEPAEREPPRRTCLDAAPDQSQSALPRIAFGVPYVIQNAEQLAGLVGVTDLLGDLSIGHTDLSSLEGLECLQSISGQLYINYAEQLADLNGLSGLRSIGGQLHIVGNERLVHLDGLANVTSVGGEVEIRDNAALVDLDGMRSLTSLPSHLSVIANESLRDIDGLSGVSSVGGGLAVMRDPVLCDLDGFQLLRTIAGPLRIHDNASLASIEGLGRLDTVLGDVQIFNNLALPACQTEALGQHLGTTCTLPEYDPSYSNTCTTQSCSCTGRCTCTGNDGAC